MMRFLRKARVPRRRGGAAAAELAVASPLLVLLILGSIDVGQFVNVGQVVANASRVGARQASQFETKNTSAVTSTVHQYLSNYYPDLSSDEIAGATTVTVTRGDGIIVSGAALESVANGTKLTVTVQFQFNSVRWVAGIPELNGQSIEIATSMRRQ